MKYYLCPLILFLSINLSFGHNLVDTTKLWNTIVQGPPYTPFPTTYTESIKIGSDTVIDMKTYRKVLRSTDELTENWEVFCFIRENEEKKVFFRADTSVQEYLLYDFGANPNDTLFITGIESYMNNITFFSDSVVVDSVDNIFFAGQTRKILYLNSGQWIEGIGCMTGILHNPFWLVGGNCFFLVCYHENGILKYQNPDYSSCYNFTTNIENIENISEAVIYPNPAADQFTVKINNSKQKDYTLELFNMHGQKALSVIILHKAEISVMELKKGIYFYIILDNNNIIHAGKITIY